MISVNKNVTKLVQQLVENSEALEINVQRCKNGATIIDAGVEVPGSYEAGLLIAEISMGGLGKAHLTQFYYEKPSGGTFWLPGVIANLSHPTISCLGCQIASWPVKTDHFFALGSGPAAAIYNERGFPEMVGYKDKSDQPTLLLESSILPDEEVAEYVAEKCGVSTNNLTMIVAPTASLSGSVQIAARVGETSMHKLLVLGFDVHKVKSVIGYGPMSPLTGNDEKAMGRANDGILYGGQVFFTVDGDDKELEELVDKIPSMVSRDYGTPFAEILKRYGGEFYEMDPLLFSPAEVTINNINSGNVFSAGKINHALVYESLIKG